MPEARDTLIDKLEEIEQHYQGLSEQMNDPEVASDGQRIVELSKEHARLGRIVEPYRRYKQLAEELQGAEALAGEDDGDAEMRRLAEAEVERLRPLVDEALEEVKGLLVMSDDEEIDSLILEIRPGTGGQEASLFCADLLGMYRRYAEGKGWTFELLSASATEVGGYREVVANVRGDGVWSRLGYEGGGHRVQRVPQTEAQGRIHTSAATVAVLPEPKNITVDIDWENDVEEHVSQAGGPGGQNVNKVASAIKLEHIPTGITVSMRDEKSQHKNRAKARRILSARVLEHHRSRQQAAEDAARRAMIGSGDRSQRVRTYNFPQNRCTDHRLKGEGQEGANFNLERIIAGDLDPLIDALIARDKAERLASFA
ncbi:MAG: peptide chain release factor 1 [Phycisphaerae bacterium]